MKEEHKLGKNQRRRPSGVIESLDGRYMYYFCSISGLPTFAKVSTGYWAKVLTKYKTEENLVKTYVCKKAQALLAKGMNKEQIVGLLNSGVKLPKAKHDPKAPKVKKEKKSTLKSAAIGKVKVAKQNDSGSIEIVEKPVYPWQSDPGYFLTPGGYTPAAVEDITKEACLYPVRYLDDECRECPAYDRCQLAIKYTEKDWAKGKKKTAPVVKKLDSWMESELPAETT
jgi:hypothetical protein